MTDTETPAVESTDFPQKHGHGLLIGLAAGGFVLLAAIVTVVLIVSLGVVGSRGLPTAAAGRALLTASDLAKVSGVEIATDQASGVRTRSLQAYVKANPGDSSNTVTPAKCDDNLEGWLAWKSLDTPSYRGWTTDTIVEASNIVVDSTNAYENDIQQARHFATVSAATTFMNAQRGWYKDCATTSYVDPKHPENDSAFAFSPIPLNLGLDAVIEGSTDKGTVLPPHLIDVYLRHQNIVYVTELVTNRAPQHGMDPVSLAIVRAAAKKLSSLG